MSALAERSDGPLPPFRELFGDALTLKNISIARVARHCKVRQKTVVYWLKYDTPVGRQTLDLLLELLALPEEDANRLVEAHKQQLADATSISVKSLSEPKVSVSYLPDPFEPFSGASDCFVDTLICRAFDAADITVTRQEPESRPGTLMELDMPRRLQTVWHRKAYMLVNLVTLSRMRTLTFFETPIRVSLNGVALSMPPEMLDEARKVLGGMPPPDATAGSAPFDVLTIDGEVGQRYVQRLKRGVQWLRPLEPTQQTLDIGVLSAALRDSNDRRPTVLFCDEVTALRVRGSFGREAQLLYPLTTDTSVSSSRKRRQFPHHALGIGFRRPLGANRNRSVDEDDAALFGEIFTKFVGLEIETLAEHYQALYQRLVTLVSESLASSPELFVGGVRRVLAKDLTNYPWYLDSLIDQSARSYACRCLRLTQRAADVYREDDVWTPMLRRARQRIILAESRRRHNICAALTSAISVTAGLSESNDKLTRADFQRALDSNGAQLLYVLEHEFEVRLPGGAEAFKIHKSDSFEAFLSFIQEQLEIASGVRDVIVVAPMARQACAKDPLALRYQEFLESDRACEADRKRREVRDAVSEQELTIMRAHSLGETVGLMWLRSDGDAVELLDLYVADHMHGSRTSQLLIREAIGRAKTHVRILSNLVPDNRMAWFQNIGFSKDQGVGATHLRYRLNTLQEPEKAARMRR